MPLLFIGSGLVLVLVGLNGNPAKLYALIASDFSGPGTFIYWLLAMVILGSLGYIKGLENFSKLFLILVLLALFLDNGESTSPSGQQVQGGGFFTQFQAYLKSTQTATTTTPAATTGGQ